MKKFGFGKKANEDDDPNRSALFGSRGSNKAPQPASNPYAVAPSGGGNPYAQSQSSVQDPYASSQKSGTSGNSGYSGGYDTNKYSGMDTSRYGGSSGNYREPSASGGYGGGYDSQSSGYGGPQSGSGGYERQGSYGGQSDRGYGTPQNDRSGGYGAPQDKPAGYGAPQDKPAGYGAPKSDQGGYGNSGGYSNTQYGGSSRGYGGDDRFQSSRPGRTGGYGGFGNDDNDAQRDELLAGARQRAEEKQHSGVPESNPAGGYDRHDGYSGGYNEPYHPSQDRQLTAEEQEEADVDATKQEIRFMKRSDVASTRNALQAAARAEEAGMQTMENLVQQGERIYATEVSMRKAAQHQQIAEEQAKELKTLNKSMFHVHVSNPFGARARREAREQKIQDEQEQDRLNREADRRFAVRTQEKISNIGNYSGSTEMDEAKRKNRLADRAKYQFEADSEDEELENEIDANLDALGNAAGRLNHLARATGREVDEQIKLIEKVNVMSSEVDDQIAMNRHRLDRIARK